MSDEPKTPEMPGESTAVEVARRAAVAPVAAQTAEIMSDDEIRRTWRVASALAQSKVFKDVTQAEHAFAKILVGHGLGISPAQSLMGVDFVKGNLQLRAVLLASFVRKSGTYDYAVLEHDAEHCKIEFSRRVRQGLGWAWKKVGDSEFSIADAKTAGLVKDGSAWKAHPRNMVFARAMSNGVKWHCPDVTGGMPAYTEADAFPEDLSDGVGSGEAPGVDLGPEVEEVMDRARELGHAGYSDRATVEMTLGDQPPGVVVAWVQQATAELDEMEKSADRPAREGTPDDRPEDGREPEPEDADVVDEAAEAREAKAVEILDRADAVEAQGDLDHAESLRAEAEAVRAGQGTLGV